jgi:hypothetical protein
VLEDLGSISAPSPPKVSLTQEAEAGGSRIQGQQDLTPVILAIWEAEIRRIEVQSPPKQTV